MGVLRETRPSGVRVRLAGARDVEGTFSVRIERDVDPAVAERASALLEVLRLAAPALWRSLQNGTPVALAKEGETPLAPLPPDRAVRLWLRAPSGREGGPVEVPLREGTVGTVTLDVARLFPEGVGGTVTLRGRVLLGNASRPPGPAVLRAEDGREVTVEVDGRFTVPDVPTWRASGFTMVPGGRGDGAAGGATALGVHLHADGGDGRYGGGGVARAGVPVAGVEDGWLHAGAIASAGPGSLSGVPAPAR